MSHAPYNPAGGNTWAKRKKANGGKSTKGKPGAPKLILWVCPNPEHHNAFPEAKLIGMKGKEIKR